MCNISTSDDDKTESSADQTPKAANEEDDSESDESREEEEEGTNICCTTYFMICFLTFHVDYFVYLLKKFHTHFGSYTPLPNWRNRRFFPFL